MFAHPLNLSLVKGGLSAKDLERRWGPPSYLQSHRKDYEAKKAKNKKNSTFGYFPLLLGFCMYFLKYIFVSYYDLHIYVSVSQWLPIHFVFVSFQPFVDYAEIIQCVHYLNGSSFWRHQYNGNLCFAYWRH